MKTTVLVGDVGGTKIRLALGVLTQGALTTTAIERFDSHTIDDLAQLITSFLDRHAIRPAWACIGVPGPVFGGEVQLTNLPWRLNGAEIARRVGIPGVTLINDLAATAAALPYLDSSQLEVLHPGVPYTVPPTSTVSAVVAPGTGLGVAYLVTSPQGSIPLSSEGGHIDFGPQDPLQDDLLRHLRAQFGRVSVERLLCGPGIFNIYNFLRERGEYTENPEIARHLDDENAVARIAQGALDGVCELCRATLMLFARCLGSHAGNLGLVYMATGGVYLGGGIPPKVAPFLRTPEFLEAYLNKGRLSEVVRRTPLMLIRDDRTPLLGAASIALRDSQNEKVAPR